jgi:ABC-2 type transport system ATP-binding protein
MGNKTVIECTNLTKDYGQGHGLFNLNLTIAEGSVFGIIGPNGAGKSTFIRLLMDLIKPTSGKATIFGKDSERDSLELKSIIGYLPGELLVFPSVTAGYILELLLRLRGIKDTTYLHELAGRFDLDLSRKYQDLSHGNKQKVGLIQAVMHQPSLLILDEPTLGLDPIVQRELRSLLLEFVNEGKTIVLSSHVLSEVETICNRIALINQGEVIREGTLNELRTSHIHKFSVVFETSAPEPAVLESLGAYNIECENQTLRFDIKGPINNIMQLFAKYEVTELDSRELSLEEVFFSEVGS